jgi:capsular polysaccharide biosynthesis protein
MTIGDTHTPHVVSLAEYFRGRDGFRVRRPGSKYRRRGAWLVNPEAAVLPIRLYWGNPAGHIPPEGVAIFDGATIIDGCTIGVAEGAVIAESTYISGSRSREVVSDGRRPMSATFGDAVFAGRAIPSRNYGHFLVDVLPRLLLDIEACPSDAPILLHKSAKEFGQAMFTVAGLDPERIVWIGRDPVSVERLFWPIPNTLNPLNHSPYIFPCLRGLVSAERVDERTRRLFIARQDASTRRLVNDEEVFSRLEPLGFEAVSPGGMPFDAQVRTFAEASVVVAVCGAALTNMVFMPPGGIVIMLLPSTMSGLFFWDIAHHRDIALSLIWGTNEGPATDRHADFRVDVEQLADSLALAIALNSQDPQAWLSLSADEA